MRLFAASASSFHAPILAFAQVAATSAPAMTALAANWPTAHTSESQRSSCSV
eukprot:CAMPEP_0194513058 /NCGR_PEP_ID=MMETSP0253-20130528/45241_1 /TAXON_ID=2966 /ORGANISM="Noctiluca scintillans" /LENGTH=51 /DNA_ID=CAMNT_0039356577 /DNA_START=26 /DNA_END=177 /DNA_ORIENTATION=+